MIEPVDPFEAVFDPPAGPPRGRRRWAVAAGLVLVAAGGIAAFVLLRDEGASYPAAWDERVVDLVAFVEAERDLEFEHPVTVDFLDEEQWAEHGAVDDEQIPDEAAALLEQGAGLFRAIGLAEGDLDLLASSETLGTSGTVGMYLFEDERIVVRGAELSLQVQSTLVHELTHVLQDQHHDIGARLQALGDTDELSPESSLRVLVEGDADRIEEAWRASLPEAQRAELEEGQRSQSDDAAEALSELPASLVTFFASDYILGAGFVGLLDADGGRHAIDDAFADPPGPDEHVLNPLTYLRHDSRDPVEEPEVPGDPIEDLSGEFGAVSWYLMLAERIDPAAALAAVESWGGDSYRAYTDGDRTCVVLRFVGEDGTTDAMANAAHDWRLAMPSFEEIDVLIDRTFVDVTTCDPGLDADVIVGSGRSQQAIGVPATRNELARQVLEGGGTFVQAACFADGVLADLPFDLLVADTVTAEQQAEIQRVATEHLGACR